MGSREEGRRRETKQKMGETKVGGKGVWKEGSGGL